MTTGTLTSTFNDIQPASSGNGQDRAGASPSVRTPRSVDDKTMVVVPAGWLGEVVGSLAGVAGGAIGKYFGNEQLGKTIGESAGPFIKHFSPYQVLPPTVTPSSAGPGQQPSSDEALIVVPAGFLSGLLGGVGGKLVGEVVGGVFGNKQLGGSIGGGLGSALGGALGPFSVAPPASASAASQVADEEPMLVMPAKFIGDLLGGVARSLGQLSGNSTVRTITDVAGSVIESIVPWQALPTELAPASAGPEGEPADDLVVVPAGWLADVAQTFGRTITRCIPQIRPLLGDEAAKQVDDMRPFSTVPSELQPASAGSTAEELVFVPAGLFGGLLTSLGGTIGGAIGKAFGHEKAGRIVGDAAGALGKLVPFQVMPDPA